MINRILFVPLLALAASAAFLLSGLVTSQAVQNPSISLDMVTSGNTYDEATNTMTVGTIDDCLASPTASVNTHTHTAHLVIENVEDLVGWQTRFNYVGDKLRISTINFTPFADNNTGQFVGFTNLPIDSATDLHRTVTGAGGVGPSAPADGSNTPQTHLAGAVYTHTETLAISPDTPSKSVPDDSSYSAPDGGILAAINLQVVGNESGQSSLFMNLDDSNPNVPGSKLITFTGTGTADMNLNSQSLGDGFHSEGNSCSPLDCVNSECPGPPTPSPTPMPTPTRGPSPTSVPIVCAAKLGSPMFVPVNGSLSDVMVDDTCQYAYFTNQTFNRVEVFSLESGALQPPIPVGPSPSSLAITPDGTTMYVTNSGGHDISVVNVSLRQEVRKINLPPEFPNDRPYSIAIANNGLALFSTTFADPGIGGRMMQLDLATEAVSQRTDFWRAGSTTERTHLRASGDRSKVAVAVGGISSGPVFVYTASTNSFSQEKDLNAGVGYIAADHTGSNFMVSPGIYVLDLNLSVRGTIPVGPYGVASHPLGAVGYSVGQSEIHVLDLTALHRTGSLSLGDTVTDPRPYLGLAGRVAISSDGELVAVVTDHGFSIVRTGATQFTPTPTQAPSPTPTPTPAPRVDCPAQTGPLSDTYLGKFEPKPEVKFKRGLRPSIEEKVSVEAGVRNQGENAAFTQGAADIDVCLSLTQPAGQPCSGQWTVRLSELPGKVDRTDANNDGIPDNLKFGRDGFEEKSSTYRANGQPTSDPARVRVLKGPEVGSGDTLQLKFRLLNVQPGEKIEVEPYMLYRCDTDPGPYPSQRTYHFDVIEVPVGKSDPTPNENGNTDTSRVIVEAP